MGWMENQDQMQSQSSTIILKILFSKVFNTALSLEKPLIKCTSPRAVENKLLLHFTQVIKAEG